MQFIKFKRLLKLARIKLELIGSKSTTLISCYNSYQNCHSIPAPNILVCSVVRIAMVLVCRCSRFLRASVPLFSQKNFACMYII